MKNIITTTVLLLLSCTGAFAVVLSPQADPGTVSDTLSLRSEFRGTSRQISASIYFRIGESAIDPDFEGNSLRLKVFLQDIRRIQADSNYVISRIEVVGTASPDGGEDRNRQLAGARAQSLQHYIISQTDIPSCRIDTINGGVNWAGLRTMIEASDMPYRSDMLRLMDQYPDNSDARKRAMQFYAGSEPWLWMYTHFFPALRIGSSGADGRPEQSALSLENWRLMRDIIMLSDINNEIKQALLSELDREEDQFRRMSLLREIFPGEEYKLLQQQAVAGLLDNASMQSTYNWMLLREKIAASDMPSRDEVLHIIDNTPATGDREQQLRSLNEGIPYHYILDHLLPELLVCKRTFRPENHSADPSDNIQDTSTTLGEENWKSLRAMIAVSEMPDKEAVLELMDGELDMNVREQKLRDMNQGRTMQYINEVFFPELLYGLSPASQENWELLRAKVEQSELSHKEQILEIIRTTSPVAEREKAIWALDDGESWRLIGEMLLPELLLNTDNVPMNSSGITLYYELSPAAKARALAMTYRTPVDHRTEDPAQTAPFAEVKPPKQAWRPLLALKTNLVQWVGVTPDFKITAFMPNLALELYFARRWSVEASALYANWDYSGNKLWAVSSYGIEPRLWIKNDGTFRGLYVGAYGQFGDFDNQQDKTEGADNRTGTFWNAGLSVGWLQPLSRHWAVELGLRGGYRNASIDWYDIERDNAGTTHYYYNRHDTEGKFSPSVRVNIIYRFGKPTR